MKFRDIIEVNRSPKIEAMAKLNDHTFIICTSDSVYAANLINNSLEEVDFVPKK